MSSKLLLSILLASIIFCACNNLGIAANNEETGSLEGESVSGAVTQLSGNAFSVEKTEDMIKLFCLFVESGNNDSDLNGSNAYSNGEKKIERLNLISAKDGKTTSELLAIEYVYYTMSPFYLAKIASPIQIEDVSATSDVSDPHSAEYIITLDVAESKSQFLQAGRQKWYVKMGIPMDGNDFVTPCAYWEYEKFQAQNAIKKSVDEKLLKRFELILLISSNIEMTRPFETIDNWSLDELIIYGVRSCGGQTWGDEYEVGEVETMITKALGIDPPSLKDSIFYCVERKKQPVIFFDVETVGTTLIQRHFLWKTEIVGERAYMWFDVMSPVGQVPSAFIYPAESMCASFDISAPIPQPVWVRELVDSDACSFYLYKDAQIPGVTMATAP